MTTTPMTLQQMADAINDHHDFTEAEVLNRRGLVQLTIRPGHSSRTFIALVRVEKIREV